MSTPGGRQDREGVNVSEGACKQHGEDLGKDRTATPQVARGRLIAR